MAENDYAKVFEPIRDPSRKNDLIASLVTGVLTLRVEGLHGGADARVQGLEPNGDLKVSWNNGDVSGLEDGERVTVWFDYNGQKFFFKTLPVLVSGGAVLPCRQEDFFQQQPRKNYRLQIPENYTATYEITSRAAGRLPLMVPLIDINGFGLGFAGPAGEKFRVGEKLEGVMTLGRHKPVKVSGLVRFIKDSVNGGQVGIEFDHSVFKTQDEIQELLLFLRHDVFKLKNS